MKAEVIQAGACGPGADCVQCGNALDNEEHLHVTLEDDERRKHELPFGFVAVCGEACAAGILGKNHALAH